MRILFLGGTRFIGPHAVRRLADGGHEVAVYHRGRTRAVLPDSVAHIAGERKRLGDSAAEFRRFAPEVVVDMIAYDEEDARSLVETFRELARRAVVVSSADVYRAYGRFLGLEPGPALPTPIAEDAPLRQALFPYRGKASGPDDFLYSYDKIPVERVVLGAPDLPGTVLRLPMVHGPGDPARRLSPYLKRMDDGRPAILLDERHARWRCPRGYVADVAAAIALAAVDDRAAGRVYNVAEARPYDEAGWVRAIGDAVGWRGEIVPVPAGRIPLDYSVDQSLDTDTARIRRELGYAEPTSPDEALAATIAWERANPPATAAGIGLDDYATEDAILAELGRSAR